MAQTRSRSDNRGMFLAVFVIMHARAHGGNVGTSFHAARFALQITDRIDILLSFIWNLVCVFLQHKTNGQNYPRCLLAASRKNQSTEMPPRNSTIDLITRNTRANRRVY